MKKVKQNEAEDQGGAALLGIGTIGLGIYLWLRARKAKELLVERPFRQMSALTLSPSPARRLRGEQLSQVWEPQYSQQPQYSRHWPWAF